jgi:alpha-methylacyl-CoA racemase
MLRPLAGLKVIEFEGIGPGPLAGRMLADLGAEVVAIVRPDKQPIGNPEGASSDDPLRRGKRVVVLNLKREGAAAEAMAHIEAADALIEGNRPGVMERLGLGPADCAKRNPRLVYGRMTGWGQDGPLSRAAGHDLNYLALSGVLSLAARRGEAPMTAPTVLGDAGGALGLAFGVVAAVFAAGRTGKGCVGALEPQFYAALIEKLGLADVDPKAQYDMATWPALKARLRELFASRASAHWRALLEGSDACFAPVLSVAEAAAHPQNAARGVYLVGPGGQLDAAPAPRFSPLG